LRQQPEQYDHVWEGGYITQIDGAYYAKALNAARTERRIGRVGSDPLMTLRLFFDIGGTGSKADAVAIWVGQFIGKEVRALDYYEAQGQPLATHLEWMRERDYTPKRVHIHLPHDGAQGDKVHAVSYESALRAAGYSVSVVENQGAGAAKKRIEAGRRLFPSIWFNEETTRPGLEALGWYHEKKDDVRGIGLGPDHDWSSHGADAFGMMCICAEQIRTESKSQKPINYPRKAYV
jgi:phage terminase large subunit